MKAFTALILASMIVSFSLVASPALVYGELVVGVKEGDWMEYDIAATGTGAPPPTHDVRWMRITVLTVQGTAFQANFTVRYANGTMDSAIWDFNLTEGNVEGWLIIPANLGPGDTFYDLSQHTGKPVNVTVQREEQKTVLGASRAVTYGNDSLRHKEWDKATGVFIGSVDDIENVTNKDGWHIENITVTLTAIATNMWSPDVAPEPNLTGLYVLAAVVGVVMAVIVASAIVVVRKKRRTGFTLSNSMQAKLAVLTVVGVVLLEIGTIFLFPFYEVGLSFAEFNLVMQTLWTALVLASMWFRVKGNYFMHEILMLIVMAAWAVGFTAVLFMDPFSGATDILATTPLRLVMNALHGIFSIPALVFGLWLVLLWRPGSTVFPAKSRRIALLTVAFWVPSYVVGVLDFIVLHTALFG